MRRKIVSTSLILAMATACLAGCGNSANQPMAGQPSEESVASTQAQYNSTELASGSVSLTVWGAEEDQELLNQIAEGFKQEYGSQADFDITVAIESESTCKDDLLGDVNNAPDVFTFVDDQLMAMAAGGVLKPIANEAEVKANNVEGAVEAASIGDQVYAYPMTADNGYFMFYNKSVFTDEDVKSLDKMLEVAAAANAKITMDWTSGWYLYSFFGNTGLTLGLNDDQISNYCDWNSTENAIKGVDVANAMLAIAANPGFLNGNDDAFLAGIADGSVVAGISGVWNASAVEAAWGSDYGAVKLPTYTCAEQQVQMASFAGYKMVGVNSYSPNVAWAEKLAEWITNEQNQTLRFTQRAQGPSNIKASESEDVQKSPAIQAIIAQSENASLQRIGGNYWTPVQIFGETMAAGNPTGADPQELLDSMVEGVTASNAQ